MAAKPPLYPHQLEMLYEVFLRNPQATANYLAKLGFQPSDIEQTIKLIGEHYVIR